MTAFILVCAVMLLAAVALFAVPLLRRVPTEAKGEPALAPATVPAVVIGLLVALGGLGLYRHASNFPWQDPRLAEPAPAGHGDMSNESIAQITRQLEAKVAASPTDLDALRMLARTYLMTNRPQDAVATYRKAQAVVGDQDVDLNLDLAEAMIVAEDPTQQAQAAQLVAAALAADGNNQKALWYSGVIAYRAQDEATAKARWTKLIELNPPPEVRQIVEQQLAALGAPVPAAAPGEPAAESGSTAATPQGRQIRVSVTLDPALQSKAAPGTVVFVAAREPGIPGPPLAATRLSVEQLPATVLLSDSDAMVEGRNLSSVGDVEVVARVAFNGSPMAASGDLVGTSVQKKGGPADLAVTISKIQP